LAGKCWRENVGGKMLAGKFWREIVGGKILAGTFGAEMLVGKCFRDGKMLVTSFIAMNLAGIFLAGNCLILSNIREKVIAPIDTKSELLLLKKGKKRSESKRALPHLRKDD